MKNLLFSGKLTLLYICEEIKLYYVLTHTCLKNIYTNNKVTLFQNSSYEI